MSEADLSDVIRLERICFSDPWSIHAFREELSRTPASGFNRVLRVGGELCGYQISWFVADEGHLANLAIAPECRRKGYALVLIEDLQREARRRETRVIWLEVRVSNRGAIDLYRRVGFRPATIRKNYYVRQREDALVMFLVLSPEEETGGLVQPKERRAAGADPAGSSGRDLGQVP